MRLTEPVSHLSDGLGSRRRRGPHGAQLRGDAPRRPRPRARCIPARPFGPLLVVGGLSSRLAERRPSEREIANTISRPETQLGLRAVLMQLNEQAFCRHIASAERTSSDPAWGNDKHQQF